MQCPGKLIQSVYSEVDATSIQGPVVYQLERKNESGSWFEVGNNTHYFLNYGDAGNMDNYTSVNLKRKATSNGASSYSNEVTITPYTPRVTPGAITGSTMIPNPQELPPGMITSTADPTSLPGNNIKWQQDDVEGWIDVSPAVHTNEL